MKFADLSFGINNQAWAVAQVLAGTEFATDDCTEKLTVRTYPWYNGRERGIAFCFTWAYGKTLVIPVFEHRNSDDLCALCFEVDSLGNPPSMHEHGALAYPSDSKANDLALRVEYLGIKAMVDWIQGAVAEWLLQFEDDRG